MDKQKTIIKALKDKSSLKLRVFDNTLNTLEQIYQALDEITSEYNKELKNLNTNIIIKPKKNSKFDIELRIAEELIIFNMHTNIFQFERENKIWETDYLKRDPRKGFSGIINIYNFLFDSFNYKRYDDLGYLIARLYINIDSHFLIEGKRQSENENKIFSEKKINKEILKSIIETAIIYSLNFDLLTPPYDDMKIATVGQMHNQFERESIRTGKRLGFTYNLDDI